MMFIAVLIGLFGFVTAACAVALMVIDIKVHKHCYLIPN